jgi:REP element-mobilizing transposase RayT
MPGAVFHITARTQGRVDWFDPWMKNYVREAMAIVQPHTDAKLRAFVVMSNHLHLVLQQGNAPLCSFMQPLLTRVALAVKRRNECDGHVFGRTYWDCFCDDIAYLTALIDYIHANPVRAGLCSTPAEWPWSSYANYADPSAEMRPVVEPFSPLGIDHVSLVSNAPFPVAPAPKAAMDLRDLMMLTLRDTVGDDLSLHNLYLMRGRFATDIRRRMIARAGAAGYPGAAIARFLGVSEATVSKVIRSAGITRPRLIGV